MFAFDMIISYCFLYLFLIYLINFDIGLCNILFYRICLLDQGLLNKLYNNIKIALCVINRSDIGMSSRVLYMHSYVNVTKS